MSLVDTRAFSIDIALSMSSVPKLVCPKCDTEIDRELVGKIVFSCPNCETEILARRGRRYRIFRNVVCGVLAFVFSWNKYGSAFFFVIAGYWLLIMFAWIVVINPLVPVSELTLFEPKSPFTRLNLSRTDPKE